MVGGQCYRQQVVGRTYLRYVCCRIAGHVELVLARPISETSYLRTRTSNIVGKKEARKFRASESPATIVTIVTMVAPGPIVWAAIISVARPVTVPVRVGAI